jgi:hypothetical protein
MQLQVKLFGSIFLSFVHVTITLEYHRNTATDKAALHPLWTALIP